MRLLRCLLGFVAVTSIIISSCIKEHGLEDAKLPQIIDATWEFKVGDQLFNGIMDSAYIQSSAGYSAVTMVGSQPDNKTGEIVLQIIGDDVTTGTYSSPNIFFQYAENGTILYQTIPGQTSDFSITITSLDSASITGTFTGTVLDSQGNPHTITDGKFTVA